MSKQRKTTTKKTTRTRRSKSGLSGDFLNELQPGDTIEIIAPASHAPVEHLEKGIEVLKSWGYQVIYDQNMIKPQIFLAQTDEYRFQKLKSALINPNSQVVWCLRGGYGSLRLLPYLEKMPKPKKKKLLIGLSDITSLQTFLAQKWGWPSLHTSMVDRFGMGRVSEENIDEIQKVLTDAEHVMTFAKLKPLNKQAKAKKKIKAKVVGGNLVVATSSLGTPSQIKLNDHILFLEELGERAYRVDRCLQQLKQAGVFKKAKAVIFGDFTHCDEPNGENYIQQVLENFSQTLSIPVYSGLENGHGTLQRPLFFHSPAVLECGTEGVLKVSSPLRKTKVKV